MAQFGKPKSKFAFAIASEIQHMRAHQVTRKIPDRSADTLLVATWNIANLSAQVRRDQDFALIGEVLSWFDLVAFSIMILSSFPTCGGQDRM